MQWPWRKPKPIYVPFSGSSLPIADRMERGRIEDVEQVAGLVNNQLHIDMMLHVLRQVRDAADTAKTPDELLGLNRAIAIVKAASMIPAEAVAILDMARSAKREEGER